MYCDKCGNKLNDGAIFCDKCGNKVEELPYQSQLAAQSVGSSEDLPQNRYENGFATQPYSQPTASYQQNTGYFTKKCLSAIYVLAVILLEIVLTYQFSGGSSFIYNMSILGEDIDKISWWQLLNFMFSICDYASSATIILGIIKKQYGYFIPVLCDTLIYIIYFSILCSHEDMEDVLVTSLIFSIISFVISAILIWLTWYYSSHKRTAKNCANSH